LPFEPRDDVRITRDIEPGWKMETDLERTNGAGTRITSVTPARTPVEFEDLSHRLQDEGWVQMPNIVGSPRRSGAGLPSLTMEFESAPEPVVT
jgi:hypothetical protein